MAYDVIVVGAGLFGQVIAANLESMGRKVTLFDAAKPLSGSKPSASLMKPSWLQSMSTQQLDDAFDVLDRLYGVVDLSFKVGPVKVDTVRWCNPEQIMRPQAEHVVVERVSSNTLIAGENGYTAPVIIIAMGVWCNDIAGPWSEGFYVPGLQAKMGASVFIEDAHIDQPFIRPWAPYKQITAFNMNGGVWVGDSSAILKKNWSNARSMQTVGRCRDAIEEVVKRHNPVRTTLERIRQGARPYVPKKHLDGKPCFLEKTILPGGAVLWVATGGAKNGTIAAGWAAHEIARQSE